MNIFGSGKTNIEKYNDDGTMQLLDGADEIQVFFSALGGKQVGKYRIIAQKITFKDGRGDVEKYTQYVVDPNDKSVNKAVVQAIVSKLNGGEEKVDEPGPEPPGQPGPQATIEKLLIEIEKKVSDTSKIIANAESINTAADEIKTAADAIKTAADAIKTAEADAIKTAADAIKTAADAIKEEDAEAKLDDTTAVANITTAVANITAAVKTIRELITPVPAGPDGGYNSAKSAAPKRITRMRRTRRLTKRTGTRRRLTY